MPTYTGTSGNDSWTVVAGGTFTLDGLDGTDTLSLGTSLRSDYSIKLNADGTVSIDTIGGASQQLHATLKNMEILKFNNGKDVLDLTTYFDTTPPTLASASPAAGATGVAVGANIVLTFSESVLAGSGTVVLKDAAGQTVESYTIGASGNLALSGNTLTVNPSADLAPGASYTLSLPGGAVKDAAGNLLASAASVSFSTDPALHVNSANAPLAGTAGNDILVGDANNNVFIASTGNDSIDGGAGIDTLQVAGQRAAYTITVNGGNAALLDAGGNVTSLANVERVQFSDVSFAVDISGNAGEVYRIYQAAFNRAPDPGGLGYWIGVMDKGASLVDIASGFVNSAEFQAMYGSSSSNTSVVTTMYTNVLHRAPDAGGLAYWVNVLDNHLATVPAVLAAISESAENQQNLAAVIGNGFAYTPYG